MAWWGLVASGAGDAKGNNTVADGIELLVGSLQKTVGRCLTVDGIDHDLLGLNLFDSLEPRTNKGFASVIDVER